MLDDSPEHQSLLSWQGLNLKHLAVQERATSATEVPAGIGSLIIVRLSCERLGEFEAGGERDPWDCRC